MSLSMSSAASRTAFGSPAGGSTLVRRGMWSSASSAMGASWSSASAMMSTGSIGGVVASLYARTVDSANA